MGKPRKQKTQKIPNNLRSLRLKRDLTMEHVAEGADISLDYLSKLERGERTLDHELMLKLAKPLHCNLEDIIVQRPSSIDIAGIIQADAIVTLIETEEKPGTVRIRTTLHLLR